MEHRMKIVMSVLLICVILGVLLYFLYKRYYEKKINQVLVGKSVKVMEPGSIMKMYIVLCTALLIIVAIMTPASESLVRCNLNSLSFATLNEEDKKGMYEDLLPEKLGDTYSLQIQEIEENLTIYYATNQKKYGYILEYKLDREPQKNEIFHIIVDGAVSDVSVENQKDGKLSIFFDGMSQDYCETTLVTIRITNFCEGENLYPVNIHKDISVGNGGILS